MIRPLPNRVLVNLLPRYGILESKLNLTLVDKKKHFEGSRCGEVLAVGVGVSEVKAGDIVWFHGAYGKSFGQNPKMAGGGFNDGTTMRIIRGRDILAVEETVKELAVA